MYHCFTYLVRWHRRIVFSIYSYVYFHVEFNTVQSWNFLYIHSYSTLRILSSVEPIKSLKELKLNVALSCQTVQARIPECVAVSFSRGSSQPRDRTRVSHIAGGFFTSWAIREAQEYWSGWPIPSPAGLPDPEIEPGCLSLQADSLPAELPGKP